MSRYRIGIEPLLIVLAAGFLSGAGRPWWRSGALVICVAGWALLAALWGINRAEVVALVRSIW